eukprot:766677-Hanusia_phi.AAC.5
MKLVLDLDDVPPVDELDSSQVGTHNGSHRILNPPPNVGEELYVRFVQFLQMSQRCQHASTGASPTTNRMMNVSRRFRSSRVFHVTLKHLVVVLNSSAGDVVEILQTADRGWSFGKIIGIDQGDGIERVHHEMTGWFPSSFTGSITPCPLAPP